MAKTSTERSRERRERLKGCGLTEVRGIYAPPEKHDEIRKNYRNKSEKK